MRFSIFITAVLFGLIPFAKAGTEADLAIGYAATYANSIGGDDNLEVTVANMVAGSNAVNQRSGSPARMRVAGYYQSAQDNTNRTSTGGIVGWLSGNDSRISDVVDFGNSVGADLVTYLCTNTDSASIGAVAQAPGRYSCYNPGSVWYLVFAHESGGHNYGLNHSDSLLNPKTIMLHNYCGGGAQPYFTNPNIWLNGVKLLGDGNNCSQGGLIAGGDEAYFLSNAAQTVADRYERPIVAPKLDSVVRRWKFNQAAAAAPAGTIISDEITAAPAVIRGNGATFTGSAVRLPGTTTGNVAANSISAYVDLPNGMISSLTNMTLEIWATPRSAKNWMHIFDFGRTTEGGDGLGAAGEYTGTAGTPAPGTTSSSDDIMLTACVGTDINQQRFEAKLNGAITSLDAGLPTAAGAIHHYAVTFTDTATGGRLRWYRDGVFITYLDVLYHLNVIEDVNNWLGRSLWSGDDIANIDYQELRLSNAPLSDAQVLANYNLGPNWTPANVPLTSNDPLGQTSFNVAGRWSDGLAPGSGKSYETSNFRLRTPADAVSRTFGGDSLKLSGGGLTYKGTSSSTTTFSNLVLTGGCELVQAGSGTWTLSGNLAANADEAVIRAANGPVILSANLSGGGRMVYLNNTVTLGGSNASFTGKSVVGDGRFSGISIDSEARLGANPAAFTADQLTLNRGVLFSTATLAIDDSNRGIRIGESAGLFNVAPGTTLTVAVPISSPAAGDTLRTTYLDSNPVAGLLIKENSGTLVFTHPNNSHNGEININGGGFTIGGAGRLNNGTHIMPIKNNGTFTYDSTAAQILSGVISGSGPWIKSSTGMLTLSGANTFTGGVTINGGTLYANAANAANNRALSFTSGITVNSGGTLRASANALFGWDGTQEKPVTVNAGGTLLADGGATGDVGVGTVTLAGGSLSSTAASTANGSWRFDDATDKLLVTADSTVSATNVKFGNAAASIDVAAGKTLNFTGTITNATSGGISYLTKSGTGTLTLAGANTHTGATAINAGTLNLSGSLAAGSAVTVANAATLRGIGTVNGPLTLSAGAIHAPGNPAGTQTVAGNLSYANNSRIRCTLPSNSNATGAASRITAGNVTVTAGAVIDFLLNAAGSTVDFTDIFWTQPRTWIVLSCANKTGDFSPGTISSDAAGRPIWNYGTLYFQQSPTSVSFVFTPYTPTELWRQANFGAEWNNPAISGDTVDGDGDGLSNLLEYALGSDPNISDAASAPQVSTAGGTLKITFNRNTAASDTILAVMASDDMTGEWTEIARSTYGAEFTTTAPGASVNETGAGAVVTVEATDIYLTTDPAHPARFMRLEVQR